jgi:Flp pilus assembly protein TadG
MILRLQAIEGVRNGSPNKAFARRSRAGVVVLEFALVAPFLLFLFLGMCELSRALMVQNMLSNAARTGCRTGIQRDKGNTNIIADVQSTLGDNKLPLSAVTITNTVTDPKGTTLNDSLLAPAGSVVSVQVSIPVAAVSWVPSLFLGTSRLESELVVMMKQ